MKPLVEALQQLKDFFERSGCLDQPYIEQWLGQFAEALERPELLARYRALRAQVEAE